MVPLLERTRKGRQQQILQQYLLSHAVVKYHNESHFVLGDKNEEEKEKEEL